MRRCAPGGGLETAGNHAVAPRGSSVMGASCTRVHSLVRKDPMRVIFGGTGRVFLQHDVHTCAEGAPCFSLCRRLMCGRRSAWSGGWTCERRRHDPGRGRTFSNAFIEALPVSTTILRMCVRVFESGLSVTDSGRTNAEYHGTDILGIVISGGRASSNGMVDAISVVPGCTDCM